MPNVTWICWSNLPHALLFMHLQLYSVKHDIFPTFVVSENTSSHSSRVSGEISPNLQRYYPFIQPAVSLCVQSEKTNSSKYVFF